MRSQNQYTIYAVTDVETASTAPANPYIGQLWVDTSQTPPLTKIYTANGWVEQTSVGTLHTTVETLVTRSSTFETNLTGLNSTVSSLTQQVTTISNDVDTVEQSVTTLQSSVSTLTQTANTISARVNRKLDVSGGDPSDFGWMLTSTDFTICAGEATVLQINANGMRLNGTMMANDGETGTMMVTGRLYLGRGRCCYIDANENADGYYVYLPGITVSGAQAVFSGNLSAPSGTIGGFTIGSTNLYTRKDCPM